MVSGSLPLFVDRLVRVAHLTEEEANLSGITKLLDFRTRQRKHHGQDAEVGLMALLAAIQLEMDPETWMCWAMRYCQNVLDNPAITGRMIETIRRMPAEDESDWLGWFGQILGELKQLPSMIAGRP